MDDLLDFLPLFPAETEEAILERLRGWANEGLDPEEDVDQWVDTREGSHWHISVMPGVREFARLYDLAGTEVPASGMVVWAWADYLDDHAEVQDIVRLAATPAGGAVTFEGPAGTAIAAGATVAVEPSSPEDEAPEFEVTAGGVIGGGGTVELPVRALEAGEAGNVGSGAVTVLLTPIAGVEVENVDAITGGTEAEADEALRERVLSAYVPKGAGNRRDYVRWGRAWVGVGRVTVIPLWNGPGTVKVIATDANGDAVSPATVAGLQADLDPTDTPGHGDGRAPIGAIVTVETAVSLNIDVEATVEFEPGYSLDGDAGTLALRDAIRESLRDYVERVESGGEIVFEQVKGRIVTVPGVHDVSGVTVEGAAVNVPVDDDPAQVPHLAEPVLIEAP